MRSSLFARGLVIGAALSGGAVAVAAADRWRRSWGMDPVEADLALPGDDLVSEPSAVETRGIDIAAPPAAVWPWLVQMGFGRGGWYSYDQLDMKDRSATSIVLAWQTLAVGDTMPTDPGGGFEVKGLEADRALVLFSDTEMMSRRQQAARGGPPAIGAPGLEASGRFLEAATPPDFAASWAFVLRPIGDQRTRLIERFRVRFGEPTPSSHLLGPLLGFGVFLMMRKQMLGIRERVETTPPWRPAGPSATPAGNGLMPAEPTEVEAPVG